MEPFVLIETHVRKFFMATRVRCVRIFGTCNFVPGLRTGLCIGIPVTARALLTRIGKREEKCHRLQRDVFLDPCEATRQS